MGRYLSVNKPVSSAADPRAKLTRHYTNAAGTSANGITSKLLKAGNRGWMT